MSERWAQIDARPRGEIAAWHPVGGIPLVVRQLRQVGRLGWRGARVVVADDAGHALVQAALARHPAPAGLTVELVRPDAPPRPGAIHLRGAAIYHRDALGAAAAGEAVPPLIELERRADVRRARAALIAGVRKSVAIDGAFSYYVLRPAARPLVYLLVETPVTPNQVTLFALACGLGAALLAGVGGATLVALAGLLYFLSGFFDHIDGDLARLRLTSSKLGEWLDSMCDEVSTYTLVAGLGVGLWRDGHGAGWAAVGVGAAIVGVATVAPLYAELHRRGMHIDTAQFPWFFQEGAGETARSPTPIGRVINALGALVRRDTNVTITALLLAFDLRWIALLAIAAAATVGFCVTATHFTVTALRRRAPR